MNSTATSPGNVARPQLQRAQFSIAFICQETQPRLVRGDISGQLTRFSTTNTALCAVKETEKHDESHAELSRLCGKAPLTTSAVLHCVYLAWRHNRGW